MISCRNCHGTHNLCRRNRTKKSVQIIICLTLFYLTLGTNLGRICNGLTTWLVTDVQLLRQIRYKKCVRYYHQFSRPRSTCRSAPRTPDTSPTHRRTRRLNRRNPPASTHTPDATAHQSANESVSPHRTRDYRPPLAQKTKGRHWIAAGPFFILHDLHFLIPHQPYCTLSHSYNSTMACCQQDSHTRST